MHLETLHVVPGRAALAEPGGVFHIGRNYDILRSDDAGSTWQHVSSLPRSPMRRMVEPSRLACRLVRQEVRALLRLSDGTYVAANREGIFHGRAGDPALRPSEVEVGDLPLMPPMRLAAGPRDAVVCGEYGSSRGKRPVRLYASRDRGASFQVVQSLEAGSVLHVHNLLYDPRLDLYWVLAGDHDHEPGIGRLSADFQRFEWFVKGEQIYRAVHVFDFGDRLVYATDTEMERNGLISLDKQTGRAERLREFEGSCIYACRFGGLHTLTTSVEPSSVNRSKWASLWVSRDGEHWNEVWRARKDMWSADYFQFGSVVLPAGESDREVLLFSGQAVQGLDGRVAVARVSAKGSRSATSEERAAAELQGRAAPVRRRMSGQKFYNSLPVGAQQMLVSAAGWRSYRYRFGAPFQQTLKSLQGSDFWSAEQIREDQDRRLRETVQWAATTVPHYQRLFRSEGIDPARIRGLDDLHRIPILSKDTVRDRPRDLRSEAISDRQIVPGHSSGTTGTALHLFHCREAFAWEYAVIWRQREWFGVQLRDKYAAFGGQTVVPFHQRRPPFWRHDRGRGRVLFSIYHMTPENLEHYVKELRQPGYRFWQGYPSAIALVGRHLLEQGIELGERAPRVVFTSSESLLDFHREQIASATGAPIADRYGHSEFAVSALQCPAGSYHVDSEFCVIEIDPHEEDEDWVRGEVIATGFANRAMPLLRYRTGDVATLRKRGSCPCGRARPILEQIDGRIEDYVVTPDGRRIGRMDHIFKDTLEIKEAQIYQPSAKRLVVRLVPRPGFNEDVRRVLEWEIRRRVGDDLQIEYEIVESVPRLPSGKFRAVISDLPIGKIHGGS